MAIGAGLSAQLGFASETVVGTAVTPTTFVEFNSESLDLTKNIVQGHGLRAGGQYDRSSRRAFTTRTVAGGINLDIPTNGAQALFKQMFGAVSGTTTLAYTPAMLTGQSLTIQKGVPQTDGVVKAFTYAGAKIPSWTIACNVGEIATLDLNVDAWDEVTSTSLAIASYPSTAQVFNFSQGVLRIGGTVAASVMGATVASTIGMKADRFFFGSGGKKAEQVENAYRTTTGTLAAEFVNQATIYDLFRADTTTSLQLTFTATNGAVLDLNMPSIYFDGETPKVGGPDIIDVNAGYTALDPGTGTAAITLTYTPV